MSQRPSAAALSRGSFWRRSGVLWGLVQAGFALLVVFVAAAMLRNMVAGLEQRGLPMGFGFLEQPASFAIAESLIPYTEAAPYWQAFLVGVANTLYVALLGIVLATLLGGVIGLGRLSANPLVRVLAGAYVELVRNVPLLVQLFVWYTVVFLNLPPLRQSLSVPGGVYLNNRGVYFPAVGFSEDAASWALIVVVLLALGGVAWRFPWFRRKSPAGSGHGRHTPSLGKWSALGGGGGILLLVTCLWAVAGYSPLVLDFPELRGFNFRGGGRISPEFAALLTGLTIYTAAFIAEVVRAGVQAVHRGQVEAAAALGLSRRQALRHIVLPQAARVILPPLVNQYLNLTKNSSLAVAIAFPDLVAIGNTIINQSGNAVQLMVLIMGTYLAISLAISAGVNWFNRRLEHASQ